MKKLTYVCALLKPGIPVPCLACALKTLHWLAEQRTSNVVNFAHQFVCPPRPAVYMLCNQGAWELHVLCLCLGLSHCIRIPSKKTNSWCAYRTASVVFQGHHHHEILFCTARSYASFHVRSRLSSSICDQTCWLAKALQSLVSLESG